MNEINKCLKEWNATLEALGQGKQSILIRTYKTNVQEFLLYPTISYANNENYLYSFQKKHQWFVEENKLPKKEDKKTEIKYYGKLENIVEKSSLRIGSLRNFYIWTPEHVKSYLKGKNANIWVLRVYELEKPYLVENLRGSSPYGNLKEDISLEGLKPVLSDREFENISKVVE